MTDQPLPGQSVPLPIPPDLLAALGYRGQARYVGVRFTPMGDEVVLDDGRVSCSGATWTYLAFKRHRAVAPLLEPFDLGSSEEEATHMLLIDAQACRASVAMVAEARAFLQSQHPPEVPLSPEQVEEIRQRIKQGWREVHVDPEAVRRHMEEQRGRVGRMIGWLDQCPEPPQPPGRRP
jgi:hypothetical protein